MKAIEYFEKYGDNILKEYKVCSMESARNLLLEISEEVEPICQSRNCKTNSAVIAVIKEINQKWNAICRLYVKGHGYSPLKYNGLIELWKDRIPELKRECN